MRATYVNGEESWRSIKYPVVTENTGELGVLEFGKELSFVVKRVFYLRDIKENSIRGMHSHKDLKQLIVCLNGEFTIELDNDREQFTKRMKANGVCLYVDGRVWREMRDFTDNAVVMVLCDREYRYDDVVRDRTLFEKNLDGVNNVL